MPSSFTARGSWVSTACALVGVACGPHTTIAPRPSVDFTIPFERYTLDNGLEVVLHEDHSDPIVAVVTIVHAGSSRDRPGRTGLAHLYQQISFNDSENVPRGANWTLIPELGGIRNGRTSTDMTVYYEVVPSDAFEKILWIDSDRLGYMINTVTEAALEREKHVAKNERRQRIDNVPYGHTQMVQRAALYSEEHPYHWPVIGSLDDLESARVEDLQSLYSRLYGTTNATLAIVGDIDIDETKRRADYWFGEISPGREVGAPYPQPVYLETSRLLMYEDNFATLPELQVLFPTVEQFHEDQYPLDILAELLASNKRAPLYEVIVDDRQLAPHVTVRHRAAEVAGELVIRVRANAGTDLDAVKAAIDNGLARFEREGVDAIALERGQGSDRARAPRRHGDCPRQSVPAGRIQRVHGGPGLPQHRRSADTGGHRPRRDGSLRALSEGRHLCDDQLRAAGVAGPRGRGRETSPRGRGADYPGSRGRSFAG